MTQIFDNTNNLKEKQVKGESHLNELSDAVYFITKKLINTNRTEKKEKKS